MKINTRRHTRSRRSRFRNLLCEQLESRRLLAVTSVTETFKTLDVSASGSFNGSGPGDSFSGSAEFSGKITYTSPTYGTGTGDGSGSGTGDDGCDPYAFRFAGNATIVDDNGGLSHSDPTETDFEYTVEPCGGGVGGSFYRSDFEGSFRTADFTADLTSSVSGYTATWEGSVSVGGGLPDGHFLEGSFGPQGLIYRFAIGGGAPNVETHETPVTTVTAYWAKGDEKLGELHEPIDVYWNQESGTVTVTELGTAPEESTSVVVIFDEGSLLEEGSEGELNNELVIPLFSLEKVEAQYDDMDSSLLTLGGYLPGVKLEQDLKLTFGGIEASELSAVQLSSSSLNTIQLELDGNVWKTPELVDMGVFTEDADISVQATAKSGLVVNNKFKVDLVDEEFDLEIQVDVAGQLQDLEDLRLIEDFTLPQFLVNIPLAEVDLPLKDDGNPYQSKLDVFVIGDNAEELFRASLFSNSKSLLQTLNDVAVGDLELVVKAADQENRKFRTKDADLSDTESLLKIELPEWMGTPANKMFNATTNAYSFDLVLPAATQFNFSDTQAEYGFFSGLQSSINAGAGVTVVAPLVAPQNTKASIEFTGLVAKATLLGQQLLDEELSSEDLGIATEDSTLAARKFDSGTIVIKQSAQEGISISNAGSSSGSLFDVGFGGSDSEEYKETLSVDSIKKIKSLTDISLTPSLSFSGDFDSSLDSARLSYQLTFDAATTRIVPADSFLKVTAKGKAQASLSFGAGISFLGFSFFDASATASLSATANVEAKASFSGSLIAPTVHSTTIDGTASLASQFDYDIQVLENELVSDSIPIASTTFSLFGSQDSGNGPEFEGGASFELLQRSRTSSDELGVSPTQGNSFALMGATSMQDQGDARIRFSTPVSSNIQRLSYDAQVLANTNNLTPGRHFLEVVLAESDTVLDRVDLASIELVPANNSLGFTSNWQPRVGELPAPLDPTFPFELEYRLLTLSGDEVVVVALDRLTIERTEPRLGVQSNIESLDDGRLNLDLSQATLDLSAVSQVRSQLRSISFDSSQFELTDAPQGTATLYPNDIPMTISFNVVDPNQSAFGILTIESNDTQQPIQEVEIVYAPDAQFYDWHNYRHPMDVDGNRFVTPLDALLVVNYLNLNPVNTLPSSPGKPYFDVFPDNVITPLDVLLVVNELNFGSSGEGEASVFPVLGVDLSAPLPLNDEGVWGESDDYSPFEMPVEIVSKRDTRGDGGSFSTPPGNDWRRLLADGQAGRGETVNEEAIDELLAADLLTIKGDRVG